MTETSPFVAPVLFHLGPVPITETALTTWGIIAVLALASRWATRQLDIRPNKHQALIELVVSGIADQIKDAIQRDPRPFLPFIGTLFLFLVAANLSPVLPDVHAPTARLETAAALALLVFVSAHVFGVRARGLKAHLAHYLKPNPLLLPLNILSEFTRTFSLMVRLFGNIMSHELILGLILAIAGLLVPIPLMALGLLIGLVQAYIFTVLATLYLGAAVGAFESH